MTGILSWLNLRGEKFSVDRDIGSAYLLCPFMFYYRIGFRASVTRVRLIIGFDVMYVIYFKRFGNKTTRILGFKRVPYVRVSY